MAAHGKPKAAGPPPPPPPPPPLPEAKKGFMRRMFPFLLAANLFVGAYVLVRTYRKDSGKDSAADPATASISSAGKPAEPVAVPRKELPPILKMSSASSTNGCWKRSGRLSHAMLQRRRNSMRRRPFSRSSSERDPSRAYELTNCQFGSLIYCVTGIVVGPDWIVYKHSTVLSCKLMP
ncbi:unnamed protein product [Urochloa humidicola]